LNVQIIEIMTPEECQRVSEFISPIRGDKMIAELEKLALLPEGVYALDVFNRRGPGEEASSGGNAESGNPGGSGEESR
jgi:hypothetical protein